MAIKANDVDPVVGGFVPSDNQAGSRAGGASGFGAAGAAAGEQRRTGRLQRANVDLS